MVPRSWILTIVHVHVVYLDDFLDGIMLTGKGMLWEAVCCVKEQQIYGDTSQNRRVLDPVLPPVTSCRFTNIPATRTDHANTTLKLLLTDTLVRCLMEAV